jgi:putative glycosyltransferase (TIGR04372 family)
MQLALSSFIKRQVDQISTEGWVALRPKLKRLVLFLPFELPSIFLALLIVLFIRIISPLIIVRIGKIDVGRIGGIYQGDWYLSEKMDGKHQGRYIDFFYFNKSTNHINRQWEKMWKRVLPHLPGLNLWINVIRFNRLLPGHEDHKVQDNHVYPDLKTWQEHLRNPDNGKIKVFNEQLTAVLNNAKPNIFFNNKEIKDGQIALENLGIPKDEQYFCFHARDSAYLDSVLKIMDWKYHNFRDSSIQNYIPAAEEMANRGYFSIRMGAKVKDGIDSYHPHVIDYSTSENRSDFNDIYIGSHCRFFLCSDGGMSSIPEMFRIPVVYVNWTLLLRISTWVLNGLFIFKKFYLKSENHFMTFSEILNLRLGGTDTNEIITRLNLKLVENTPEEIHAVTIEMDERLNGTWETTDEDEELQQRFWALFGPDKLKSPDLRIGAQYLRDNQELLK